MVGRRARGEVAGQATRARGARAAAGYRADARGAVLVVHGDPGVGKTALLEYAVEAGFFASFGLPASRGRWSSTTRRCNSSVRRSSSSPSVSLIFSVTRSASPSGSAPDRRRVRSLSGSRFSAPLRSAERQPLLCVVDDAQARRRIGPGAFVARRLLAERIALAFATRDVGSGLARFPELRVDPLGRRDARVLLESALAARLDESVLDRIVAETGGNPLALLELPRGLTPAQLAGGFGLPAALPLSTGIEQSFARRLARLRATRGGCCSWLRQNRSATLGFCGVQRSSLGSRDRRARRGGGRLVDVGRCGGVPASAGAFGGVRCGRAERAARGSPRALADATDPQLDPDRRAWHRARRRRPCRRRWPANSSARRVGRRRGRARRCRGFPRAP